MQVLFLRIFVDKLLDTHVHDAAREYKVDKLRPPNRIKTDDAVVAEIVLGSNELRPDFGVFDKRLQLLERHSIFGEVQLIGSLDQLIETREQLFGVIQELNFDMASSQKIFVGRAVISARSF